LRRGRNEEREKEENVLNNTFATGSCSPPLEGLGEAGKAFNHGSKSEDLPYPTTTFFALGINSKRV
jgi:hypothetical protein